MKKIFILIITGMFLNACEDILEQDPITQPLTEVVFSNQDVVSKLLPGAYQPMRWEFVPSFGDSYAMTHIYTDVRSDDVIIENTEFQSHSHDFENSIPATGSPNHMSTSNVNVALIWSKFFTGIARANQILDGLGKVTEEEVPEKELFIAECKFLRAYYYFEAVKNFGEVPVFTEKTDVGLIDNIRRKPIEDVYAQIYSDFRVSMVVLPDSWGAPTGSQEPNELYRGTRGAAMGLLAKAYLYQEQWDSAAYFAQEVINTGQYALEEDYAANWELSNEHGIESLFEIAFYNDPSGGSWNAGAQGSLTAQFLSPPFDAPVTGWSYNLTTPELLEAFRSENDTERLDATILLEGHEFDSEILADQGNSPLPRDFLETSPAVVGGQYQEEEYGYSLKYFITPEEVMNETTDFVLSPLNHKVLRYAEILLILAEATLNGAPGDGQGAFDQVRERAGLQTKPLTYEALKLERRLELATEWNRYYDLQRWGDLEAEIDGYRGQPYLPIPQDEIDLVGPDVDGTMILKQNDGY